MEVIKVHLSDAGKEAIEQLLVFNKKVEDGELDLGSESKTNLRELTSKFITLAMVEAGRRTIFGEE